jgi:hypothetical protein
VTPGERLREQDAGSRVHGIVPIEHLSVEGPETTVVT